jgi:hypothetical protein
MIENIAKQLLKAARVNMLHNMRSIPLLKLNTDTTRRQHAA